MIVPDQILRSRNVLIAAHVQAWRLGSASWEQSLMGAIIDLEKSCESLRQEVLRLRGDASALDGMECGMCGAEIRKGDLVVRDGCFLYPSGFKEYVCYPLFYASRDYSRGDIIRMQIKPNGRVEDTIEPEGAVKA